MSSETLLKRMRAAREFPVELAPGKTLTLRRPTDFRLRDLRGTITPAMLASHITAWAGVTEADLLGPALGSDAVVAFELEVAQEALEVLPAWYAAAADALLAAVKTYVEAKAESAKN